MQLEGHKNMENTMNNFYDKGLLQNGKLYQYLLETSVYPRELEPLKKLREITASHPLADMGTAPDAGQFISLLLKLVNARKTIEIGVYTGYSLLLTALAIPDDGTIIAIDRNKSTYNIGLPIIKETGVEHKINFVESDALSALTDLLENGENVETFDFAFVDADKANNLNYHEKLLKLIKPGGIIAYDNTLWGGRVVMPEELVPEDKREVNKNVMKFNKFLAADTRVEISQLPLGDGLTICRRI